MSKELASIKGQFPSLRDGGVVYLDTAATAQMPDRVLDRLVGFETSGRGNVHDGGHRLAQRAFDQYEAARGSVARFLGVCANDEIVFSYGATGAINLACFTLGRLFVPGDEIVLSVLEHHSNIVPWQRLAQERGLVLRFIPATPEGRLDLSFLGDLVTRRCRLVAVTHCSNVTGAVTQLAPIVSAARAVGALVLVDGAQRVPHGPVDIPALGVDLYAFSGHKAYGPTGIGVLWARREVLADLEPFMSGGQMIENVTLENATFLPPPQRFEAGTPPIAQAIGLGAALDWMLGLDWSVQREREAELTEALLDGLDRLPGVRPIGPRTLVLRQGVVSFTAEGICDETLCRELDRRGVAVRSGHLCAQPAMSALGVASVTRASLGCYSEAADVEAFLNALSEIIRERGRRA